MVDFTKEDIEKENERAKFAEGMRNFSSKLAEFLIRKNEKYGNSVNNPMRVFSNASDLEQINIRMDDKLSRLARGVLTEKERADTLVDLTGYLIILLYNMEIRNMFDSDKLTTSKHMD